MKKIINEDYALNFWDKIKEVNNIILVTHTNPDGDAIGSVTAMEGLLKNFGKKCAVITPNRYPEYLSILDNKREILNYRDNREEIDVFFTKAELIIALDFNQLKRVDDLEIIIRESKAYKILIDHHPSPEDNTFDLVFSSLNVSSTCEYLYWLIKFIEKIDSSTKEIFTKNIAESLYVGLMTDTNNYANSVLSSTFLMAADLINKGVDKEMLQHAIFGGFSHKRMMFLGYTLLNKTKIVEGYGAAYIVLTKEELKEFDFQEGDTEGFVNMPLNIKGVNISALFVEHGDYIRVSMRSIDEFSVNKFSRTYFNGGGHERAAGGRLYISVEQVAEYFESKLKLFMNNSGTEKF